MIFDDQYLVGKSSRINHSIFATISEKNTQFLVCVYLILIFNFFFFFRNQQRLMLNKIDAKMG